MYVYVILKEICVDHLQLKIYLILQGFLNYVNLCMSSPPFNIYQKYPKDAIWKVILG